MYDIDRRENISSFVIRHSSFAIDESQQENMEYEFVIRHSSFTITERQQENMEYEFVIRH